MLFIRSKSVFLNVIQKPAFSIIHHFGENIWNIIKNSTITRIHYCFLSVVIVIVEELIVV